MSIRIAHIVRNQSIYEVTYGNSRGYLIEGVAYLFDSLFEARAALEGLLELPAQV